MNQLNIPFLCLLLLLNFKLSAQKGGIETAANKPNIVWLVSEDNSIHYSRLYNEKGASMPNVEALAKQGVVFNNAFSNAPVCSVARSTLIAASYAPRIGTQYHRKIKKVPMPDGVEMFPYYLGKAGYYTTNNSKEDYNIHKSDSVWAESSRTASYKNRQPGQPFFHVQNFGTTHEGQLHFSNEKMEKEPLPSVLKMLLPSLIIPIRLQADIPMQNIMNYTKR